MEAHLADALLAVVPAQACTSVPTWVRKEGLETTVGVLKGATRPLVSTSWKRLPTGSMSSTVTRPVSPDQRDNRSVLQQYAHGKTVLNCFPTGGFSIAALHGGAEQAINIDASQPAR